MRDLSELGFTRFRDSSQTFAADFADTTGIALPTEYLEFLCYQPSSENYEFAFKFFDASNEEWEGSICEFSHVAGLPDSSWLIHNAGASYLPIASDAGGNYLYLELSANDMPVVDVDASSGAVTRIAASFADFVGLLYPVDDWTPIWQLTSAMSYSHRLFFGHLRFETRFSVHWIYLNVPLAL